MKPSSINLQASRNPLTLCCLLTAKPEKSTDERGSIWLCTERNRLIDYDFADKMLWDTSFHVLVYHQKSRIELAYMHNAMVIEEQVPDHQMPASVSILEFKQTISHDTGPEHIGLNYSCSRYPTGH